VRSYRITERSRTDRQRVSFFPLVSSPSAARPPRSSSIVAFFDGFEALRVFPVFESEEGGEEGLIMRSGYFR